MPGFYGHNISLKVDTSGLKQKIDLAYPCEALGAEINADLSQIAAKIESNKSEIIRRVADASQNLQISALNSYGSNKSGRLAGSIAIEGSGTATRVGTNLFYAQYLNDGRGSVTAKNAKVLHFFLDGEEVFVHSVGPAAPRPYVDDSSNMLDAEIDGILTTFIDGLL